mmetsp:Transcript_64519/g.147815  ORF Transcript_64519/g.147815 Transcript_64519/m.147815 type:complete len:268 (-) Transcript_64519:575-1378(-)
MPTERRIGDGAGPPVVSRRRGPGGCLRVVGPSDADVPAVGAHDAAGGACGVPVAAWGRERAGAGVLVPPAVLGGGRGVSVRKERAAARGLRLRPGETPAGSGPLCGGVGGRAEAVQLVAGAASAAAQLLSGRDDGRSHGASTAARAGGPLRGGRRQPAAQHAQAHGAGGPHHPRRGRGAGSGVPVLGRVRCRQVRCRARGGSDARVRGGDRDLRGFAVPGAAAPGAVQELCRQAPGSAPQSARQACCSTLPARRAGAGGLASLGGCG